MTPRILTPILLAAVLGLAASPALASPPVRQAQTASPAETALPHVNVSVDMADPPEGEQADYVIYAAALSDFNTRGFAALQSHLAALREALGHAPTVYPVMAETDAGWVIHAEADADVQTLAQVIGRIQLGRGGGAVQVKAIPNVYPRIALMLGSDAIEGRRFEEAHHYLDIGLALQPLDGLLLNEKLIVLHAESKWAEAYERLQQALAADDPLLTAHPARLQRRLGYTLVELGRLDEAKAAYEASLVSDPDSELARNELQFIANAQAGHPNYGAVQITAPLAPHPDDSAPVTRP